eukprot:m.157842 g.157842  ORF g.157842 m.157842 type:complete len:66 (+) comp16456_c0_seq28:70-267(+)
MTSVERLNQLCMACQDGQLHQVQAVLSSFTKGKQWQLLTTSIVRQLDGLAILTNMSVATLIERRE